MLAYDYGAIATPVLVAMIGAASVIYQVRTQRSNSADHSMVSSEIRAVHEEISEVKDIVMNHLEFHLQEQK